MDAASLCGVEVILALSFRELQELDAVDLGGGSQTPKLLGKGELYFVSSDGLGSGMAWAVGFSSHTAGGWDRATSTRVQRAEFYIESITAKPLLTTRNMQVF